MCDTLLESLSQQFHCFISDLKSRTVCLRALLELQRRPAEQYALSDWAECLSYLLDRAVRPESYPEVGEVLREEIARFSVFSAAFPIA